jgi:uncharacterized protein YbbC (DUF1343 family)
MTESFQLGIDRLISEVDLRTPLAGRRVALLGHPASVTRDLVHSLDALAACGDVRVTAVFGPQHGMRGEAQDNMIESDDYVDPVHGIPVFSLYGAIRRPTAEMLDSFDVLLVDLQDLGCRVYTYLTTLLYLLEDCSRAGKSLWVLDRPNPAGRTVEGAALEPGQESFVGAVAIPMRHGVTLGEAARWFVAGKKLDVDLQVVAMSGYGPDRGPGFGWPLPMLAWVNPSPNAPGLSMARCYAGTVLLEGTNLSEGRGTTTPLEVMGAPDLDVPEILSAMQAMAPDWMGGCRLRPCAFEPVFHKHAGRRCQGLQVHATAPFHDLARFRPYRLVSLFLKAVGRVHPDLDRWREPPYEYVHDRLPVDVINGGSSLREWIDDQSADAATLDRRLARDERAWEEARAPYLLY